MYLDVMINGEPMKYDLHQLEQRMIDDRITLEKLQADYDATVRHVLMGTRIIWGTIQGAVRAAGGAISMTQRLVVSAGIAAVQTLMPILTSSLALGTANMDAQRITMSLIGLANLTTAIAALVQFEQGNRETSLQLRGLNFMLSNISMGLSMVKIK